MRRFLENKYFQFLLRAVLGFIFIYAGAEKIADPHQFASSVSNYQLLNEFFINLTAVLLPWLEVFSGILLLSGAAVKENSFILSFLLAVFVIAGIVSLMRGLDIDCGCFGSTSVKLGVMKIFENMLLLIAGILIYFYGKDTISIHKS